MNIAYVVHRYSATEGTGGYVVKLVNRVAREHSVTVYATEIDAVVPSGVEVIEVPARKQPAYATILTFPRAFERVRRRHDIVHAQGWVAHRAEVVTAHIVLGAWLRAARRFPGALGKGERLFGRYVAGRERKMLGNAGLVIAPGAGARDDIRDVYGIEKNVTVIHHGFPEVISNERPTALRDSLGIAHDAIVALYVGDARKGLDIAVAAVADNSAVHLVVASGSGSTPYLARARRLGCGDRIHWSGHVSDLRPIRQQCDILLHPTIYDTFGLAVSEAMADGLPVVVSDRAGVSELIAHGVSGWVLKSVAPTTWGDALRQLAENENLRGTLGNQAKHVALSRSWDVVAEETLAAYRGITQR